jgi:hypothetical protein
MQLCIDFNRLSILSPSNFPISAALSPSRRGEGKRRDFPSLSQQHWLAAPPVDVMLIILAVIMATAVMVVLGKNKDLSLNKGVVQVPLF